MKIVSHWRVSVNINHNNKVLLCSYTALATQQRTCLRTEQPLPRQARVAAQGGHFGPFAKVCNSRFTKKKKG